RPRNRLGIGELVEPDVSGAARRYRYRVRPRGVTIGEIDGDLDVSFSGPRVEQADGLVAPEDILRSMAPGGDVPFGDRPVSASNHVETGGNVRAQDQRGRPMRYFSRSM